MPGDADGHSYDDGDGTACSFARSVRIWVRLARDLGRIFFPALLVVAIPAVLVAVAFSRGFVP